MADTIGTAYVQIEPSFDGVVPKIDKQFGGAGESGGKSFGNGFAKVMGGTGKVVAGATVAAGTAIAGLSGAFINAASDVASYGDNIDKMSQKMGISAEAYQEWDAVMQHSGTSMETMKASMKTLATAAETGKDAFDKLGISQEEIANMSQEQLFESTIAALQQVDSETERTYLAGQLLGKGATELGALLNTSAEDTQAMRDRVRELGGVMSSEAVSASAAFQDQLQDMQTAFSGLSRNMMSEFLPSMTTVMAGLTDIFSGNSDAGVAKISEGVTAIADGIMSALPALLDVAANILTALADALISNLPMLMQTGFEILGNLVEYIVNALPQLVTIGLQIITELANSIASALPELIPTVADVLVQIVNGIIENLPMLIEAGVQVIVGLVQGIIEALPILIDALPELITGIIDALMQSLPVLIQGVIQMVNALVQNMPTIIQALIEAAPQILTGIIGALVANAPMLVDAFIQLFAAVGSSWGDITMMLIQSIPQSFVEIANAFMALGPILVDTFNQIMTMVGPTFNQIGQFAQGAWAEIQQAFANVGEWFRQKFTAASNGVKNAFNNVKTFFQNLWKSIQQIFSDAVSKFTSIGSNIANGILKGLSDSWANLKAFLQKACGDLISLAKKILGIASPSKEFAKQVGQWIPAGIAQGIHDGMGVLNKEIQGMSNEMLTGTIATSTEAINSVHFMQDAGAEAVGSSVVINNNIRVDGAQDPEAWTQTFISTLKREARMA